MGLGHAPIRPFKCTVTDPSHPITQGVRDFVVTDEQHYYDHTVQPDHVFLQSVNEDGLTFKDKGSAGAAGWAFPFGQGRVCMLAPGHTFEVLMNPEYAKVQKSAVRWLLENS